MLQIINNFTKRFNMQKQLIIFPFPLPATELVRKVVTGLPDREFVVNGPGVTSAYLSECGLKSARIIEGGMDLKSRISLILSLRRDDLEDTIYIGPSSDLVSMATSVLSGSRNTPINYPVSQELSSRQIYLIPLLARLAWRLALFFLTIPVLFIQRVLFSGSRKKLKAKELVLSAPVAGEILPPVSIVIPNFNGRKLLAECLPSLLRAFDEYRSGGEIILVDDASSDGSVKWVKDNFTSVRVIALDKNQGFGRAANLGISSATNRTVVLLNSDIIVDSGFLRPLIEHLRDPELFAVQPRLNNWAGDGLDLGINIGHMENGYIRIWNEKETGDKTYLDFPAPNLYAVGGAMAFDRKKWDLLGGFDDIYYPFCWEDIDISYRAWKRGWKVLYEPESLVNHLHYGTISRFFAPEYKQVIEQRNELLFIWKNIHSRQLWRAHLNRLPILLLGSLLNGNMVFYKAFWRSVLEILPLLKKRKEEMSYSRIEDQEVFRESLLPFQNWVKSGFHKSPSGSKPQLLIVNTVIPYPPVDGGKIRLYQMMKNLSSRYDIHFVAFFQSPMDLEGIAGIEDYCVRIDTVPLNHLPLNCLRRALIPEFCQGWICREMEEKIGEIIRTRPIDLIQIDCTLMAYYGSMMGDIPGIFVELDAGILKLGESYNPTYRGWRKIFEIYEWLRMLRFELDFLPNFSKVVTLNPDDTELLKSFLPSLDVVTVTMGTDLDQFLEPYRPVENCQILYVGSLGHYPNVDAIRWFVSKVLPKIRSKIPEVVVKIVGSGDPSGIEDIRNQPGVIYIGPVDDVRPYLRESALSVAPVRLGSGMKGKVLEALAMAKPMVATSVATRGIPVASGRDLIIADEASAFSEGVIRLLRDPALKEKVARNGQKLIEYHFGWKRKADEMDMIYQEIGNGE
jgi:GT2 family glycosyltransferase/glycosyltransferase involved in cell wall biosynthesis